MMQQDDSNSFGVGLGLLAMGLVVLFLAGDRTDISCARSDDGTGACVIRHHTAFLIAGASTSIPIDEIVEANWNVDRSGEDMFFRVYLETRAGKVFLMQEENGDSIGYPVHDLLETLKTFLAAEGAATVTIRFFDRAAALIVVAILLSGLWKLVVGWRQPP